MISPGTRRLLRGTAAGAAGTAAMSATLRLERWFRSAERLPFVDYDASPHVVIAASKVIRHHPRTPWGERALFLLVHWGYGSAVGAAYDVLADHLPERDAAVAFFAVCQSMAFALFPLLGETPPPWRWRPDLLASSLGQHAVYVIAASRADRALRPAAAY